MRFTEKRRGMFLEKVMANKNFKVAHLMVGALRQGYVVSEDTLKSLGYQKNRLLRLGAIVPTDEDESKDPIPLGPEFNHGTHPELAERMHGDAAAMDEDVDLDDESRPREVSGGRVVDVAGQDRPTIASDVRSGAAPASRRILGGEDEEIESASRQAHRENLDDLTVEDLKERARKAGVEGYSGMVKADLVKAVKKAEQAQAQR